MSAKIYIANFPFQTTEDELTALFEEKIGEVLSTKIIVDRETGRSKGFGFMEFAKASLAHKAIEALNGFIFNERNLRVNIAIDKPPRDRNSDYRGRQGHSDRMPGRGYQPEPRYESHGSYTVYERYPQGDARGYNDHGNYENRNPRNNRGRGSGNYNY